MDNLICNYIEDVMNGGHNYYFSKNMEDKTLCKKMKKLLSECLYIIFKDAYDVYKKNSSLSLDFYDKYLYENENVYYEIANKDIRVDDKITHDNYVNKFINFYDNAGILYDNPNTYNTNLVKKLNKQEYVFMDFLKNDLDLSRRHLNDLVNYVKENNDKLYIKYYLFSYLIIFNYRTELAFNYKKELLTIDSKKYPFTIGMLQLCNEGLEKGDLINEYPDLSNI